MSVAEEIDKRVVSHREPSEDFVRELRQFATLSGGVSKLRELILDLAVRGKLVEQREDDESAEELLKLVLSERKRLQKLKVLSGAKVDPRPRGDEIPHELPTGWVWTRLSILGQINPKNVVADETEVSFLPMASIDDGFSGGLRPESRVWKDIKKGFTHVADGDLILAKITPCFQNRKSAVVRGLLNGVGAGTTELHVMRPIANALLPEYGLLNLKCLTYLEVGVSRMTGSAGQKRVPRDYFSKTPFPLPPLAEQKRIVAKVDSLMRLCDRLESQQRETLSLTDRSRRSVLASLTSSRDSRELASSWRRLSDHFEILHDRPETLADLRQTILALAVQGKLVKQDPNDESAHVLLAQILKTKQSLVEAGKIRPPKCPRLDVDNPRFAVPASWMWTKLGAIAHTIESGWSPKCDAHPRVDEDWGVLKISAVTWDEYRPEENKALPVGVEPRPAYEVQKDDFLMSRANTAELVAKSVVVRQTPPRLMLNDKLLRVDFSPHVALEYVNLVNNSSPSRSYYESVASGTSVSMRNVSRENVTNLPIPLPPFEEQKRIVAKADRLLAHCDRVAAGLRDRQSTAEQLLTASIHRILQEEMD